MQWFCAGSSTYNNIIIIIIHNFALQHIQLVPGFSSLFTISGEKNRLIPLEETEIFISNFFFLLFFYFTSKQNMVSFMEREGSLMFSVLPDRKQQALEIAHRSFNE